MDTAKIFWSGRSQAVRLPKAFRLEGSEVRIRKQGQALILEPLAKDWKWLDDLHRPLDAEAVSAAEEQPTPQERPELDGTFR